MRILFTLLALVFAVGTSAAELLAAGKDASQRGMCREEIKNVCGDIKPGDGKLRQCMETSRDKFSPACKERMEHMHDKAEARFKACEADTKKFCTGIEPGGGRLHQCLMKNDPSLSPECRAAIQHKPRHSRPAKDAS